MDQDAAHSELSTRLSGALRSGWRKSRNWSYYVGSTAVFLLGVQVITGCLLLLHYQPNVREAHNSVAVIATQIPMGWLVRSVHHTSANVLVVLVMLHALYVLLSKMFRGKRALSYYTGAGLLAAALFMCFTGYLLPWDRLSVSATAVGSGLTSDVPWVGPFVTEFLRGGVSVSGTTLSRFFAFHVSMVPMVLALGLCLHVLCIRRHGMRRPPGPNGKRIALYPDFLLRQSMVALWVFALILTWAVLFPTHLRLEGDPMAPAAEGIRPEWYFLAAYEVIKFGGNLDFLSGIGITAELLTLIGMAGLCVVMIFMPKLDRRGRGRVWKGIVLLTAGAFVVLTVISMIAPETPGMKVAEVTERLSVLRERTIAYLFPFWLTVLTLTWFLGSAIRLQDRITAFGLPDKAGKT